MDAQQQIRTLVLLYSDISATMKHLQEACSATATTMQDCSTLLTMTLQRLPQSLVANKLCTTLVTQCIEQQIKGPLSLIKFQKTEPTQASKYIANILKPILAFRDTISAFPLVQEAFEKTWRNDMIDTLVSKFIQLCMDELENAQRTATHLQRMNMSTPTGKGMSAANIVKQMQRDAQELQKEVSEKLNMERSIVDGFKVLEQFSF